MPHAVANSMLHSCSIFAHILCSQMLQAGSKLSKQWWCNPRPLTAVKTTAGVSLPGLAVPQLSQLHAPHSYAALSHLNATRGSP